uniref:Uncharacterized protein n=1 Tax=Acrobeloides nanus TaxID=290746 RepID=A0A914BWV7_9BILA
MESSQEKSSAIDVEGPEIKRLRLSTSTTNQSDKASTSNISHKYELEINPVKAGTSWLDEHQQILDIIRRKIELKETDQLISDFDDEAITELFNEHFPRDIANNDFNSLLSTMDVVNEMKERFPKPHVDFMQHIIDIIQWTPSDKDKMGMFNAEILRKLYKLLDEWPMHDNASRWYWLEMFTIVETDQANLDEVFATALFSFRKMIIDMFDNTNLKKKNNRKHSIDFMEFVVTLLEFDYAGVLLCENENSASQSNRSVKIEFIDQFHIPLAYFLLCENTEDKGYYYQASMNNAKKLLKKWIEYMQKEEDQRVRFVYARLIGLCLDSMMTQQVDLSLTNMSKKLFSNLNRSSCKICLCATYWAVPGFYDDTKSGLIFD